MTKTLKETKNTNSSWEILLLGSSLGIKFDAFTIRPSDHPTSLSFTWKRLIYCDLKLVKSFKALVEYDVEEWQEYLPKYWMCSFNNIGLTRPSKSINNKL